MIAIKNLEKYLEDHPELAAQKDAILAAAKENAEEGGEVLTGGAATEILGDLASAFFREVQNDPDHRQIGEEALSKFGKQ